MTHGRTEITFVTSSAFKKAENAEVLASCALSDGTLVADKFEFVIIENTIKETLDVDLHQIVTQEAKGAYGQLKRPCIVEHAGLVFADYKADGYPGGLTKPMWDTLKDRFLEETHSQGRAAIATAVIGYCDGRTIRTFVGETPGTLSDQIRGTRDFYWDTVFIPDGQADGEELTYAEIVERDGLKRKMVEFSQSSKAMVSFLEWRLENEPDLWMPID